MHAISTQCHCMARNDAQRTSAAWMCVDVAWLQAVPERKRQLAGHVAYLKLGWQADGQRPKHAGALLAVAVLLNLDGSQGRGSHDRMACPHAVFSGHAMLACSWAAARQACTAAAFSASPQQRQCWMVGLRQPHRPRSPLGAACHRLSSAHHKEAALIVQQQAVQLGLHLCRQGTAGAASRLSRGRPDSRCRWQRLTALCDCKPCCRAGSSAPAPSWEGRQARVKLHLPACLTRLSRDAQRQLGALNRRRDDL